MYPGCFEVGSCGDVPPIDIDSETCVCFDVFVYILGSPKFRSVVTVRSRQVHQMVALVCPYMYAGVLRIVGSFLPHSDRNIIYVHNFSVTSTSRFVVTSSDY